MLPIINKRDMSEYLVHLTRSSESSSGFENLFDIVKSGIINGSCGYIKGSHKCVCFTESTLSDIVSYIKTHNELVERLPVPRPRYELYGIAINKKSLFSLGARPVIYQPDDEYHLLPADLQYRHVRFDPQNGIDFSWEREWRLQTEYLDLNNLEAVPIILVYRIEEIFSLQNLVYFNSVNEANGWGSTCGMYTPVSPFEWPIVPLEIF